MLKISELYIYPIKSLGGVQVNTAVLTDRGFQYDRRWMLVDEQNRFLSQRERAKMALLKVNILSDGLKITNKITGSEIIIPFTPETEEFVDVVIWDDTCTGQFVSKKADKWFTNVLNINCRLVYMPDKSERQTDLRYTPANSFTSFSDAYPFMIIGQSSLDDLNSKLDSPVPIDRFRPNIVFTGGDAYEEDTMDRLVINHIIFHGVKLCARCNIPTINQDDATNSKEPSKTLATYRFKNNNVYLGQNLISEELGSISVGDQISVLTTHTEERFMI
jgi:uncharacterized protein YcbX